MYKAEKKFVELRDLGTWDKRSEKDDPIIALNAQVEVLRVNGSNANTGVDRTQPSTNMNGNKKGTPKWKYDRSHSSGNELEKNGTTYKWYIGPCHNGNGTWINHSPGKCTGRSDQNV